MMQDSNRGDGTLKPGEASAIFLTLHADITALYPYELIPGSDLVRYPDPASLEPSVRRSLVRAVFAFIEGCAYFQRQMLLSTWNERLSEANRMALSELQISVTGQGEVRSTQLRIGSLNMIRLTVQSFEKAIPGGLGMRCEGAGFEALVRATKVRDRLMHPKSIDSLQVSDADINDVVDAFLWFTRIQSAMTTASTEEMRRVLVNEQGLDIHIEWNPPAAPA